MSKIIDELKQRVIQEFVPGKQVTTAYVIANPRRGIHTKLGLTEETSGAIGILTTTPGEATIIAVDVASESARANIESINRFSGTLLITGDVSSVGESLRNTISTLESVLHFTPTTIARL